MESAEFEENYPITIQNLKRIYGTKILQVEKTYLFDQFHHQKLTPSDIDSKPMVLLLGQYSVGKTSFIEYLLKKKFPGSRVGIEPTTDRFVAVMYGDEEQIIPGNAISVDTSYPFTQLNSFGSAFLNRFEASKCHSKILKNITLIDTPGVLAGTKQTLGRCYEFIDVCQWFVDRADLILLLFDAHKLDISDEFQDTIMTLKGNEDKVRVVLNKSDQITVQQLMRVYGALMWSLGKVVRTPEVLRVFISSFWNEPYRHEELSKLFKAESDDLIQDLLQLPRNSAIRKVNEMVKRVRLVRVHMLIVTHLRGKMPMFFGKQDTQNDLIEDLEFQYAEIAKKYKISMGDFPPVAKMQAKLREMDFSTFEKFDQELFDDITRVLTVDLPKLLIAIKPIQIQESLNPFEIHPWVVDPESLSMYTLIFNSLVGKNCDSISGNAASEILMNTGIPIPALRLIWELCDIEKNGKLNVEEFALALFLSEMCKKGEKLPLKLPENYIPPSRLKEFKRNKERSRRNSKIKK